MRMWLSLRFLLGLAIADLVAPGAARAAPERIVFVRHGEKPAAGLGQLDCQGLNRALRLPAFFAKTFGKPDAIFAPDPAARKEDSGKLYDYIRPLMTIEPTAVAFGLPVNTQFGFSDVKALESALQAPEYAHALVLVAWEHKLIDVVVRDLLKSHGGDPAEAPDWDGRDFDGVDVVTLQAGKASFTRLKEGLNGQPEACAR
jgi:hypothetical protein